MEGKIFRAGEEAEGYFDPLLGWPDGVEFLLLNSMFFFFDGLPFFFCAEFELSALEALSAAAAWAWGFRGAQCCSGDCVQVDCLGWLGLWALSFFIKAALLRPLRLFFAGIASAKHRKLGLKVVKFLNQFLVFVLSLFSNEFSQLQLLVVGRGFVVNLHLGFFIRVFNEKGGGKFVNSRSMAHFLEVSW
jgi:hypothetical protein